MSTPQNIAEIIKLITQELEDTKAQDLKVLDLTKLSSFTDYFIIATGNSDRHVQALADKVHLKLKNETELLPLNFEGHEHGQWILLDYGEFVIHLFQPEFREYYNLEEFWQGAKVSSHLSHEVGERQAISLQKNKFSH